MARTLFSHFFVAFNYKSVGVMLARRKLQSNTVAERIGITPQNLSVEGTGRTKVKMAPCG